jgi:hypothetical protein
MVGQWRLVVPAVGQDAFALVDQTLVIEPLERPDHGLHVIRVERLVVVLEVDPATLAAHIGLPVVGVLQHGLAAGCVELLDAQLKDLALGLQSQDPLCLELGRQPVGVPAEPAFDPAPAHGLVARDEILDVPGEQVAVVRQAVGERGTVVEDELVRAVLTALTRLDRRHEGAVLVPVLENALLDRGKLRARDNATVPVRGIIDIVIMGQEVDLGVGHWRISVINSSKQAHVVCEPSLRGRRLNGAAVPPRLPHKPPLVRGRHTTALA